MEVRCPHCQSPIGLAGDSPLLAITCPSCGSSFSLLGSTASYDYAGQRTIGHFELVEQIGSGSFGAVWRARDTELDRTVAVKIPHRGQLGSSEAELFLREARAAAQVRHPNIVTIYEVGREADTVFIVSEHVQGLTLAEWLTAKQRSAREAATLCARLAEAVHHAHEAGVVHRDLKPANIMLDASAEPHIMDFGLARRETTDVTMTLDGRVLGTPAYMSPEQAKGEGHHADRRSDVYSLGVILFELLTAERPFRGSTRMLLQQILQDAPPSPRKLRASVPRDVETICLKCLEKEPGKRYPSAKELAEDLRRFLAHEPIQARPITRAERAWRWCKRNRPVAGLMATVAMLLLLGTAISSYFAVIAGERAELAADKTAEALLQEQRASEEAERNRRLLYISDMNVAQRAWEDGNIRRVHQLLKRYDSKDGATDLRNWEWYYLWRAWNRSQQFRSLAVEEMPISLSLVGDEAKGVLATGHARGTVTLWRLQGKPQTAPELIRREGRWFTTFVSLSPDGRTLAYPNGKNAQVVLRNVESGEEEELSGYSGFISAVAFSPNGKLIAAAGPEGLAAVWDLTSRQPSSTFTVRPVGKKDLATHPAAFSPDSKLLAIGTTEGAVELWDVEKRRLSDPLKATTTTGSRSASEGQVVRGVAFSPEGALLAAGLEDGTIRLWDMSTRQETILTGHRGVVYCVAFSPKGDWLASSSHDCTIKLWDMTTQSNPQTINGHSDGVMEVAFSRDGKTLVSAGLDYWVGLWPIASHTEQRQFGDAARHGQPVFADDGTVASIRNGVVRFWDLATGEERTPLPDASRHAQCIAISKEGLLAIKSVDAVDLWDLKTKTKTKTLPSHRDFVLPQAGTPLVFSRDGRVLALGGLNRKVSVWDVDEGALVTEFHVPAQIQSLAISPNGRTLATAGEERIVRLWDVQTGSEIRKLTGPIDTLRCVTFSPDGKLIAAGGFDNAVRIWHWQSDGGPCQTLTDAATSVFAVAFSEDGRTLFTGDGYGVRAWDVGALQQRFRFESNCYIYHLTISRDSSTMAASAAGGAFQVWRFAKKKDVDAATW